MRSAHRSLRQMSITVNQWGHHLEPEPNDDIDIIVLIWGEPKPDWKGSGWQTNSNEVWWRRRKPKRGSCLQRTIDSVERHRNPKIMNNNLVVFRCVYVCLGLDVSPLVSLWSAEWHLSHLPDANEKHCQHYYNTAQHFLQKMVLIVCKWKQYFSLMRSGPGAGKKDASVIQSVWREGNLTC